MKRKIEYASFEVTSYCNLNCSFCNRDEVIKNPKHISVDSWTYILEKLKSHPIREAKLQGLGEPFMHPDFAKLCKIFKEYFPESKILTATNCQYRITENFTSALKSTFSAYTELSIAIVFSLVFVRGFADKTELASIPVATKLTRTTPSNLSSHVVP